MLPLSSSALQAELETRFRSHWERARAFARNSVEHAWHAGTCLAFIKERLPHGEWGAWLAAEGLSESTARRLRQLATLDLDAALAFDSMAGALSSLPRKSLPRSDVSTPSAAPPPAPVQQGETAPPDLPDAETVEDIAADVQRERLESAERRIDDLTERAALQGEDEGGKVDRASLIPALRERVTQLEADYHKLREAHERAERELGAVRRDLLAGKNAAEILAVHFGVRARSDA